MRQKEKGREEIYFLFICLGCETPSLIHSHLHCVSCSFLCVADEVPSTLKRLCSWYPTHTEDALLSNTHTHTHPLILFSFFFLHTSLCLSISFPFFFVPPSLLVTSLPSQHRYECQTTKRYHRKSVGKHWHHHWEGEKGGKDHLYVFFPSFEWHCCFERSLISSVLIILYLLAEKS